MIEAAAQLCTIYFMLCGERDSPHAFIGLGAIDRVRFRSAVSPGEKLILVARNRGMRRRLAQFDTQGFVDGRLVFEASITGVEV